MSSYNIPSQFTSIFNPSYYKTTTATAITNTLNNASVAIGTAYTNLIGTNPNHVPSSIIKLLAPITLPNLAGTNWTKRNVPMYGVGYMLIGLVSSTATVSAGSSNLTLRAVKDNGVITLQFASASFTIATAGVLTYPLPVELKPFSNVDSTYYVSSGGIFYACKMTITQTSLILTSSPNGSNGMVPFSTGATFIVNDNCISYLCAGDGWAT